MLHDVRMSAMRKLRHSTRCPCCQNRVLRARRFRRVAKKYGDCTATLAIMVASKTSQTNVFRKRVSLMATILKFFRIIFFYALYFLMCMVVVAVALQGWPVGGQMLFSFGLPILLVWWQERRKAHKALSKLDICDAWRYGPRPCLSAT